MFQLFALELIEFRAAVMIVSGVSGMSDAVCVVCRMQCEWYVGCSLSWRSAQVHGV